MNSIIEKYYPLFESYQALRGQLMLAISDEHLAFTPGGNSHTLGYLCREMGEVQYSYTQSFKTFQQVWTYKNDDPLLETSVDKLTGWYTDLDREMRATIEALSEEDIRTRTIARDGFNASAKAQLDIYEEALLIFYGKVSVYLKILGIPLPEQWENWIA
ncbi:MAG: hypothetical protein N2C13_03345 [Chloroflexota bacterium]